MSANRDLARALLAAATPGPWRVGYCDEGVWKGKVWCNTGNAHPFDERVLLNMNINGDEFPVTADAALIAAAPGLLAALCDALVVAEHRAEEAEAQAAAMRDAITRGLHAYDVPECAISGDGCPSAQMTPRYPDEEQPGCYCDTVTLQLCLCGDNAPCSNAGCAVFEAISHAAGRELLDRLQAAEQDRDRMCEEVTRLLHRAVAADAERDALRAELAQEAALRAELAAEVKRLKDVGADLLAVAQGCTDYGGGHRDACYDAFQDGIWTVVNVLKKRLAGDDDYQMRVLKAVGSGAAIAEGGE